ncbi:MAG: glycogen synthase GlgA [Armatimonadetes bacterium]|nr:glycogen synthase GlgA [Armatimonadota bacterium]
MKTPSPEGLNVLFVAAEAAPLAKVGGLADVVGALPKALRALGYDVRVALPHYGLADRLAPEPPRPVRQRLRDRILDHLGAQVTLARTELPGGITAYLVGLGRWFGESMRSEDLYTSDPAAYAAFSRAASLIALDGVESWRPQLIHCHDWHSGLTAVYMHVAAQAETPASVFTIHNLAYSGVFGSETLSTAGLPPELYTMDGLEYYGGFSFLKAGMVFSEVTNTVSPQYAREVETPEYGGGMAGLVTHLRAQGRFSGILNGIDTSLYDPTADATLPLPYSSDDRAGKAACKAALQADCGLDALPRAPLFGMVSRICNQKGHDVVASAAHAISAMGAQLVILGVGDEAMSDALRAAASRHPRSMAVRIGYDAYLASRIYAGSDMFLMPSRFEPCGLGQLIALRYGSVPVVRSTGGLADTVHDAHAHPKSGNGFVFDEVTAEDMLATMTRAVGAYRTPRWGRIVARGMRENHDWSAAAQAYAGLYGEAIRRRASGR